MPADPVLVDTSVWIDFFRNGESVSAIEHDRLLDERRVMTCGLVEAELIPGLRRPDRGKVRDWLRSLPRLETTEDVWGGVTAIQEMALARGAGPFSIPDLVVAALAMKNDVCIFSLDRHFEELAAVSGLRLHRQGT